MFDLICVVFGLVFLILGVGVVSLCIAVGITGFLFKFADIMIEFVDHCKRWNKWRKKCTNGWFHKFLVLIGWRFSPTFILTLTDEEIYDIAKGLDEINTAAYDSAINLVKEVKEDDKQIL